MLKYSQIVYQLKTKTMYLYFTITEIMSPKV